MTETALRIEDYTDLDTSRVTYWKDSSGWWIYLPSCGAGILSNHAVTEHEDGTITATPSILMHGHKGGETTQRHGYLTHGEWREC